MKKLLMYFVRKTQTCQMLNLMVHKVTTTLSRVNVKAGDIKCNHFASKGSVTTLLRPTTWATTHI
jgi:hypothetical protein